MLLSSSKIIADLLVAHYCFRRWLWSVSLANMEDTLACLLLVYRSDGWFGMVGVIFLQRTDRVKNGRCCASFLA